MKNLSIFIILILVSQKLIYGQINIKEFVSKYDATSFNSDAFNEIITRQNSCSLYLKDFLFSQSKEGKFLVELQIKLNSFDINSSSPSKVKVLRLLFNDVIEIKEINNPIKLSLSNSKIADNIILTDVTDIDIDVRLIPIRNDYTSSYELIKPLLNTVVKGTEPAFFVIDNFINISRKDDNKAPLIFHANINVPLNIFEFNKLKKDSTLVLLENSITMGIILSGQNDVSFNNSLGGEIASFINGISKFIYGKNSISKGVLKYEGLLSLFFTKDVNPLLPKILFNELNNINDIQNEVDFENSYQKYGVKMKEIGEMVVNSRNEEKINNQTAYSILTYLRLGEIFMNYKIKTLNGSSNELWIKKIKAWDNDINYIGAANGVKAIGITDIYNEGLIAKIYIPYGLSDDLTLSFYSWQVQLHKMLFELRDISLAQIRPKNAENKSAK